MDAQSTQCSCSIPDIDECELEPCHEQAICTNTDGSYTCACNLGFTGDGIICEGMPFVHLQPMCITIADCHMTQM